MNKGLTLKTSEQRVNARQRPGQGAPQIGGSWAPWQPSRMVIDIWTLNVSGWDLERCRPIQLKSWTGMSQETLRWTAAPNCHGGGNAALPQPGVSRGWDVWMVLEVMQTCHFHIWAFSSMFKKFSQLKDSIWKLFFFSPRPLGGFGPL